MNIAFFSDNFYPELGGIQDSLRAIISELARRGHTITCFAARAGTKDFAKIHEEPHELDLGRSVTIHRIVAIHAPSPTQQSRLAPPTLYPLFLLRKIKPDIIHTHTFFGLGIEGMLDAKILGIPFVGTNHCAIDAFSYYTPFSKSFFTKVSSRYVSWYYNRCDFVSAPSQSVFDTMQKYKFSRPHHVVSNPIAPLFFNTQEGKEIFKKKYAFSPHVVVCAGRLGVEKRIEVIIRAVEYAKKTISDIELVIVGHGSHETRLRALADELGIHTHIRWMGSVDHTTLAEIFSASDIFAIASTSETQSMVLLQAMARGLPAVGVHARALPEYIQDGETGCIAPPEDDRIFGEKLVLLFQNHKLREKYGKNASEKAKEFSVEKVADEWERIYQGLINEKS